MFNLARRSSVNGISPPSETRGNPFSSYTPQQYGSVSRTSVSSGNSTYSERDGRMAGRSEALMSDSKKQSNGKAEDEVKANSPVKILSTGMDGRQIGQVKREWSNRI